MVKEGLTLKALDLLFLLGFFNLEVLESEVKKSLMDTYLLVSLFKAIHLGFRDHLAYMTHIAKERTICNSFSKDLSTFLSQSRDMSKVELYLS